MAHTGDETEPLASPAVFAPSDAPRREPRPTRGPVDPATWSQLHAVWSDDDRDPPTAEWTCWSIDELNTFAAIAGAASFPTVPADYWAGLPDAGVEAAFGAILGSFLARGLIAPLTDGKLTITEPICETMDCAVFPDLAVSITSIGPKAPLPRYIGVRPDRAVRVDVLEHGPRRCADVAVDDVVAHLLTALPVGVVSDDAVDVPTCVSASDVSSGAAGLGSLTRVSTAWREGSSLSGAVQWFAVGGGGRTWLADIEMGSTQASWTLTPTDRAGVRGAVLDCLPGIGR